MNMVPRAAARLRPRRGSFYPQEMEENRHGQQGVDHFAETPPPPSRLPNKRARLRNEDLTDDTPVVFDSLDWLPPEIFTVPRNEPGVVTLMGLYREDETDPAHQQLHGDLSVPALAVYDAYRVITEQLGYDFPEISDVLKAAAEGSVGDAVNSSKTAKAWEIISDRWTDGSLEFVDADGARRGTVEATFDSPAWLFIRCEANNCEVGMAYDKDENDRSLNSQFDNTKSYNSLADKIRDMLKHRAALVQIRHETMELVLRECNTFTNKSSPTVTATATVMANNQYLVEAETGCDDVRDISSLATTFKLYRQCKDGRKKLVGRALCSYVNEEMATAGPTLEGIEIACDFRGLGLGTVMMDKLEDFYSQTFLRMNSPGEQGVFRVNHAMGSRAVHWFLGRGFRDPYGFGEELQKVLTKK